MKKLRNWWTGLFDRRVFLTVNNEPGKHLMVIEVDKGVDNIKESLGMTDERAHELGLIVAKAFMETDNVVATMALVSKSCKHANESFYTAFLIVNKQRDMYSGPAILAKIFGMGDPRSKE
jgi:hypothetical protein